MVPSHLVGSQNLVPRRLLSSAMHVASKTHAQEIASLKDIVATLKEVSVLKNDITAVSQLANASSRVGTIPEDESAGYVCVAALVVLDRGGLVRCIVTVCISHSIVVEPNCATTVIQEPSRSRQC